MTKESAGVDGLWQVESRAAAGFWQGHTETQNLTNKPSMCLKERHLTEIPQHVTDSTRVEYVSAAGVVQTLVMIERAKGIGKPRFAPRTGPTGPDRSRALSRGRWLQNTNQEQRSDVGPWARQAGLGKTQRSERSRQLIENKRN